MKKKVINYLISFGIACLLSFLIMVCKGIFNENTLKDYYSILSDSFFVGGAVLFCFGFLFVATNEGVFDMLTYGVRKIFDLFRRDLTKVKYRTFYDYKESRKNKKVGFVHLILIGLVFMAIGGIFLIYYENVA